MGKNQLSMKTQWIISGVVFVLILTVFFISGNFKRENGISEGKMEDYVEFINMNKICIKTVHANYIITPEIEERLKTFGMDIGTTFAQVKKLTTQKGYKDFKRRINSTKNHLKALPGEQVSRCKGSPHFQL